MHSCFFQVKEKACVLDCPITNCVLQTCCGSMKDDKVDGSLNELNIIQDRNGYSENLENSTKGIFRHIDGSKALGDKL